MHGVGRDEPRGVYPRLALRESLLGEIPQVMVGIAPVDATG